MKSLAFIFAALFSATAFAADQAPRGSLLELHSSEVYAGPCMINSEVVEPAHYMVRVWDFSSGKVNGENLKGLRLAVLQRSTANLAEADCKSSEGVVYLPEAATEPQRQALLAWLKSNQPDLAIDNLKSRVAPLQFTKAESGYGFSAGNFISVKTAPLQSCNITGCGEVLWYLPRAETSRFTVVVDEKSSITEPLLKLSWSDGGKRNIFLGRFGESETSRNAYVTLAELCGTTVGLF